MEKGLSLEICWWQTTSLNKTRFASIMAKKFYWITFFHFQEKILSYAASYWPTLHPTELGCTLRCNTALHTNLSCILPRYPGPSELCCTILSYAAHYCAMMHATELFCPLLSNCAPFWATKHPSKLLCSLGATEHPTKLCCTLLSSLRYAAPYMSYLPSFNFLEYRQKKLICIFWWSKNREPTNPMKVHLNSWYEDIPIKKKFSVLF
jgi:hypothetical protein